MNSFEYLACAPPHCKCSKLKYHNGVVEIEDDYGNTICIPEHEMTLISEKWIKELIMVKELKEASIDIIDDSKMVLLKDDFKGECLIPFDQFEELVEFYNKNKGE